MATPISTYESDTVQCAADDCSRGARVKGLCNLHYQRQRVHGSIVGPVCRCIQCDAEIVGRKGRKFCSRQCIDRRRSPARNAERRDVREAERPELICLECGTIFKPNTRNNSTYCTKRCGMTAWQRKKAGFQSAKVRSEIESIKRMARRASASIARASSLRRRRLALIEDKRRRSTHACSDCGASLQGPLNLRYCEMCGVRRAKVIKRISRGARKAKLRAVRVERFDPVAVLERDRWRCHMCGCSTPKRLRGSYDDRAPELDHIIPLAVGGEHSRKNTACACRKCNIAKGSKPLGQLRLVA